MNKTGITKAQLSRGTGIRSNTISDWQTKGTNPSSDKISCICEFLNISTDYLLTGKESARSVPSMSEDVQELVSTYESLDAVGQTMVKAKAFEELRRLENR